MEQLILYEGQTFVTLRGLNPDVLPPRALLAGIAGRGVNLDIITQTPHTGGDITFSFSLPDSGLGQIMQLLAEWKRADPDLRAEVNSGNLILALLSPAMVETPGMAAAVYEFFDAAGVRIQLITTSDVSISCLFAAADEMNVHKLLADRDVKIIQE